MKKLVGLLLVLVGMSASAWAGKEAERRLEVEPVPGMVAGDGPQFVRADRTGKVFLFCGDDLEVYPVSKGVLAEPERLQASNEAPGLVLNAALSPSGDQWLLHAEGKARLFVDGKEKPLPPLSWQPWTVGFLRDTPVVGVMPRPLPSATLRLQDMGTVPWLVTLDNDRWSTLVDHSGLSAEAAWKQRHKMNEWVEEYASFLTPARDGKLWVASQYAYQVERLSPSGKPLLKIVVGKRGEEAPRQSPKNAEAAALARQVEKQGGKARFQAFTGEPVIADLAEGTDRAIYLLVHASGETSLVLDRYDPVRNVLERVPLRLKGSGRFTLASGKDGLYLAPFQAKEGLWKITWEALESASWKLVEESEIRTGERR